MALAGHNRRLRRQSVNTTRTRPVRVEAAQLLRDTSGATRVVAFGALTSPESFARWSDVDIAAWGIPARQYFRAVPAVTGLSSDFRVDLIDADDCTARLLDHVTSEGTGLLRTPTA